MQRVFRKVSSEKGSPKTEDLIEIVQFIRTLQKAGKSDEEIVDQVHVIFDKISFSFAVAELIDDFLSATKLPRNYWRCAYDYPKEGEVINVHGEKQKVIYCGLFTFAVIDPDESAST